MRVNQFFSRVCKSISSTEMDYTKGVMLGLCFFLGLSKALPMLNDGDLPPVQDVAKMARYIVHTSGEFFI